MRSGVVVLALLLAAVGAVGQSHEVTINAETPEGQVLQQIGQEADAAKKIALMEQFLAQFPTHEGALWVYSLMVPACVKAGEPDKALNACEKLLALDPKDIRGAHDCLKAAEAKKDPDVLSVWAGRVSEVARAVAATPKPQDEDQVEGWKTDVDFAKQFDTYTEYSLYAATLQSQDPAKKIMLFETLEKRNPQSQYLPQSLGHYFIALRQAGQTDKAAEVAEKVLEKDPNNEDMLLFIADYHLQKKSDPGKILGYSEKLAQVMGEKPKPAGVSDEDWDKKKALSLGLAHWMSGVTYSGQNKFPQADKALRQALPYIEGNDQLLAGAYFHLGLANYKMEKILDAIKFNEACIKIKSPFQAQAQRNLRVIRSQYRVVR